MNIRRHIYRFGWPLARLYYRWFKPHSRGARALVWHGDKILMVRNSYGKRHWSFPGGHIKRRELPEAAARRELKEETGVEAGPLVFLGTHNSASKYGTWDTWIYEGKAHAPQVSIDESEVLEAGWFPLNALPQPLAEHVKELLAMRKAQA